MRPAQGRILFDITAVCGLGRELINMIEMAPETARRCKEKRAGRGSAPGQALRRGSLQPFRRPSDVVHLSGYFVAKGLKMVNISCAFAPRIRTDGRTPFRPDL